MFKKPHVTYSSLVAALCPPLLGNVLFVFIFLNHCKIVTELFMIRFQTYKLLTPITPPVHISYHQRPQSHPTPPLSPTLPVPSMPLWQIITFFWYVTLSISVVI